MPQHSSSVVSNRKGSFTGLWCPAGIGAASLMLLVAGPIGCSTGTPFESIAQSTLSVPVAAQQLTVENSVGDVIVMSDQSVSGITAVVSKKGRGSSQIKADEALAEIRVSLAEVAGSAGTILAKAVHPKSARNKNYSVEWRISAPPGTHLVIGTDVGGVSVKQFIAGAKITTDVGDIDVAQITGGLVARTDVGDITAKDIEGNLDARTDVGDISARASGKIDCRTNVGDLSLSVYGPLGEPIVAMTDVGDLDVRLPNGLRGSISAAVDVGDLSVKLGDTAMTNVEKRRKQFAADFAAPGSKLNFQTDIGDLTVRLVEPGT